MKIYNTMTNKIEEFIPLEEGKVKLYVCGPTVYNNIHLGNARPIIVFDILARYFKYKGYKVDYVQNFTDVDDKIINKANEEKISTEEVTEKYIQSFFEDIESLNVLKDIKRPKVTENMPEIIEIIDKLIEKGYAYSKNGDVFFDVMKYDDYGKLSNQKIEELEAGTRVNIMETKNNPLDFALWKSKKEGEPYWDSPWGQGRPGWHIECSAMARKYLGDSFDIHGGGQDLVFPHHENEIAQSKCAYHGHFARYWMHNGFIQVNGDKMSKSLGNFFLLKEILEKFSGNVIRLFMLSTHYRKPINFCIENIEDSKKALENIVNSLKRFKEVISNFNDTFSNNTSKNNILVDEKTASIFSNTEKINVFNNKIKELNDKFEYAMDEDMNTPQALSVIFDQIRETNKYYDSVFEELDKNTVNALENSYNSLIIKIEDIFGINISLELSSDSDSLNFNNDNLSQQLINLLLNIRTNARKEKNFKLSDEIRDNLKELGIEIKDNKDGTTSYTRS